MPSEWRETTLGEMVDFGSGWRNSEEAVQGGQFPFFTCSREILRHDQFDFDTEAVIMAGNNADARFHLQYYKGKFAVRQRTYVITPRDVSLDCRYLYYALHASQALFAAQSQGTTTKFVTIGILRNAPLSLPPLSEQRSIAAALGALDDKIELDRRMSETLESMARVLFKSWLVDFDPVRARAEGRARSFPERFADALPNSFEDSDIGEIPTGWKVAGLDGIGRFLNGLALQKFPPTDGRSLPVVKIAQLRSGNTVGADRASAGLERDYVVEDGDILFSWSGSLECVLWAGGRGALNQHLFKVTSEKFPKWLLYLAIHHHLEEFRHIAAGKATTMGHIQRHHLSGAKLALPPEPLLREMDGILSPILDRILNCSMNSRSLAAARDVLLPKLVSGEIRVGEPRKES